MLNDNVKDILKKKESSAARIYGSKDFVFFRYYDDGYVYIFTKYDVCRLKDCLTSSEFSDLSNLSSRELINTATLNGYNINCSYVCGLLLGSLWEFSKEELTTLPDWIFEELVMLKLQE